jgi:hypothetical protein
MQKPIRMSVEATGVHMKPQNGTATTPWLMEEEKGKVAICFPEQQTGKLT